MLHKVIQPQSALHKFVNNIMIFKVTDDAPIEQRLMWCPPLPENLLFFYPFVQSFWRTALFVFCTLLITQADAQMQAPNYTVIGRNEGIPEMKINGLVEDIDGFVWFANGSALCRWDGQHFQQH